jgi:hypothetical protein
VSYSLRPGLLETNLVSTILGFGDERSEVIAEWIGEFEANDSNMRGSALASQLGEALESYLGIDKDILTHAFLRTIHDQEQPSG